jgi:hypothetical protein
VDNNLNYIHIIHKVKKEEGEGELITNIFQIIIWINSD